MRPENETTIRYLLLDLVACGCGGSPGLRIANIRSEERCGPDDFGEPTSRTMADYRSARGEREAAGPFRTDGESRAGRRHDFGGEHAGAGWSAEGVSTVGEVREVERLCGRGTASAEGAEARSKVCGGSQQFGSGSPGNGALSGCDHGVRCDDRNRFEVGGALPEQEPQFVPAKAVSGSRSCGTASAGPGSGA